MKTIFLLIWFLTGMPDGNHLEVKQYQTIEACQAEGDSLAEASKAAKDAKAITDFGGVCYPVQVKDSSI